MPFQNLSIVVQSLPRWEMEDYNSLDPKYKKYRYYRLLIVTIIAFIGIGVFYFYNINEGFTIINPTNNSSYLSVISPIITICLWLAGIIIFYAISTSIFIKYSFKNMVYVLREKDLVFKKGVFWKTQTIVPFVRIQHSEISQGPIERKLNIGSLKLFTAGGSGSDLSINGLPIKEAQGLKNFINEKTK